MRRRSTLLALGSVALIAGAGPARALVSPDPPAPTTTLASREAAELQRLLALGLPVYCGGSRTRYVAFTFDDGPGPYTARVLRILRRSHVRATFFLVGRNVAGGADLPRLEAAMGGVGDHTWTHAFLPGLSPHAIDLQLASTKIAVARSAGSVVDLFRPPYGAHTPVVDRTARRLGMVEILWSVDTRDSEGARWSAIAANVERNVRPGAIVLMHENRGQTVRALKFVILPWVRRHHYVVVGVSELLARDPPTLAQLRRGGRGCA